MVLRGGGLQGGEPKEGHLPQTQGPERFLGRGRVLIRPRGSEGELLTAGLAHALAPRSPANDAELCRVPSRGSAHGSHFSGPWWELAMSNFFFCIFFKDLFIYLKGGWVVEQRERESQPDPELSMEPEAGLDPKTLRS